jgi:hypothetical protein
MGLVANVRRLDCRGCSRVRGSRAATQQSVPLPVLEQQIDAWIAEQKATRARRPN